MRLIDTDELKKWVENHFVMCHYYHPYSKREKHSIPIDDVIDMIDRVPSVDAIPVEWIIEWEKKEENYYRYKDMVRLMIDDWRKEHEVD